MEPKDVVPYLRSTMALLEHELVSRHVEGTTGGPSSKVCEALRDAHATLSVHVDRLLSEGSPDVVPIDHRDKIDFFRVSRKRAVRLIGILDGDYHGEFEVLRIRYGSNHSSSWEPELHGFIRFDGCANWSNNTTGCMVHFCDGTGEADEIALCLKVAFSLASQYMAIDGEQIVLPPEWKEPDVERSRPPILLTLNDLASDALRRIK